MTPHDPKLIEAAATDAKRRLLNVGRWIGSIRFAKECGKSQAVRNIEELGGVDVHIDLIYSFLEHFMKADDEIAALIAAAEAKIAAQAGTIADLQGQLATAQALAITPETEAAVVAETAKLTAPTA